MVCNRCKMAVTTELEKLGIHPLVMELGEVEIASSPSTEQLEQLGNGLERLGFELIDDKRSRIIEQIKNLIVKQVHYAEDPITTNLSDYITSKLHYDYNYLSNLFSGVEGSTIEKFFIAQKIEKVKELLVYDELNLSEIADQMGYSSVAYLSAQFKKVTGLTPTFYRSLKEHKRKSIDHL